MAKMHIKWFTQRNGRENMKNEEKHGTTKIEDMRKQNKNFLLWWKQATEKRTHKNESQSVSAWRASARDRLHAAHRTTERPRHGKII